MKIREYKPDDYSQILEICSFIWDGNDYLPKRITDYYEDNKSYPMIIEDEGKVASVGNMRFITDEIVWLEAMRTHPEFRGRGFGTALTNAQIEKAINLGARQIWLFTSSLNEATKKITEKLGFTETELINFWRINRENKSVELKNKQVIGLDEDGVLGDLDLLEKNCSERGKLLSSTWIQCTSPIQLKNKMEKLGSNLILGEFLSYPYNCDEIDNWIASNNIYFLDEPTSILTIRESKEVENVIIIGVTTTDKPEVLEAALLFTKLIHPNIEIEMFYPFSVKHQLFEIPEKRFRLMIKKI